MTLFDRAISAAAWLVIRCDRLRGIQTIPTPGRLPGHEEEIPVVTTAPRDGAGLENDGLE